MGIRQLISLSVPALALAIVLPRNSPAQSGFKRIALSDKHYSEGSAFGDFNGDGAMDLVSGPFWYEGPSFSKVNTYYAPKVYDGVAYSDNMITFVHDFNGDGRPDIWGMGLAGQDSYWWENPGTASTQWTRRVALQRVGGESPGFADINKDGRPDLVGSQDGFVGWGEFDPKAPAQAWKFHRIHSSATVSKTYWHGQGAGDINGDGRLDILQESGWAEQPSSLAGDPAWKFTSFAFGRGAQIYAYDMDGDGDNDVVASQGAHDWGMSWFRQDRNAQGGISFMKNVIVGTRAQESQFGVAFSQIHAIEVADMDGDGLKDIITGKRWWAHGPDKDPEADSHPAVLYWFKLQRTAGGAKFLPVKIDDNSGVGTQFQVGDFSGDGKPDVVIGNKKGTFAFVSESGTGVLPARGGESSRRAGMTAFFPAFESPSGAYGKWIRTQPGAHAPWLDIQGRTFPSK